jgi:hypothetical protein
MSAKPQPERDSEKDGMVVLREPSRIKDELKVSLLEKVAEYERQIGILGQLVGLMRDKIKQLEGR